MVIASTLAPAVTPLCAMGVAIAMALLQWCPWSPGIFDGYLNVTVGTFHETSPISSEPPLTGLLIGSPRAFSLLLKPVIFLELTSFWTAFASNWSLSDQVGKPTVLIFLYMVSAIVLLKCLGQAVPRILELTFVLVIKAAPSATSLASRYISIIPS